jgi:tetratricopeptide (TPR) repeat protein
MGLESGNVTPAEEKVSQILRKDLDEEPSRDFGINLDILREKLADGANPIGVLIDNLEPALDENYRFREKLRGYDALLALLGDRDVFSFTLITSRRSLIAPRANVHEYSLEGLDITAWRQYFHDCEDGTDSDALMRMCNAYKGNAKVMKVLHGMITKNFDKNIETYWNRWQLNLDNVTDYLEKQEDGRKKILHNLGRPEYFEFIGREEEREEVHLQLSESNRNWIIVIDGIGGVGKSSLALNVALDYINPVRKNSFDSIVWITAKTEIISADGILPNYQSSLTLDKIINQIAIVLRRLDIVNATPEYQSSLVRQALTDQRVLIVLDNYETINDKNVFSFLLNLPAPTKCIVTTRHRIDINSMNPIRLTGMSDEEAMALIQLECKMKAISISGSDAIILLKNTGGIPLAIRTCIGQLAKGFSFHSILSNLQGTTGDLAKFCFEYSFKNIDALAQKVLLALSLFGTDASKRVLCSITGLDDFQLDNALIDIEILSLSNRNRIDKNRFEILPLTAAYIHSYSDVNEILDMKRSYIQVYYQIINQYVQSEYWIFFSKAGARELHKFMVVENKNVLKAFDYCFDCEKYLESIEICYCLIHYMGITYRPAERLHILEKGVRVAERLKNLEAISWLLIDGKAWVFLVQKEFDKAKELLTSGRYKAQIANLDDCVSLCDCYLALIAIKNNEMINARSLLANALALAKSDDVKVRVYQIAGEYYLENEDRNEAMKYYDLAQEVSLGLGDVFQQVSVLISKGFAYIDQQKFSESNAFFREALTISDSNDFSFRLKAAQAKLGISMTNCEDTENSKQLASEAYEVFNSMGFRVEVDKCLKIMHDL